MARLVGRSSLTVDFVDHFRAADREFDYHWEERWVRDEGYQKLVPRLVADLLERTGVDPGDVTHFCMPSPIRRVDQEVAKAIGLPVESIQGPAFGRLRRQRRAHPLLMLVSALERARPGDTSARGRLRPGRRCIALRGHRCDRRAADGCLGRELAAAPRALHVPALSRSERAREDRPRHAGGSRQG